MSQSSEPVPSNPRDLPPGGGPLARLHLWAGDTLIRAAGLLRPPLTLGVRLAAFDEDGRVFLVRHSYRPGWHLPGGAVEAGETARQAAVREAREEGGIEVTSEPELLHLYHHRTTGRRDHIAVFVAQGARQAPGGAADGLEIREAGFYPTAALPEGTSRATRSRIAEALGEAAPGDHW